jgi:hypothetical protein
MVIRPRRGMQGTVSGPSTLAARRRYQRLLGTIEQSVLCRTDELDRAERAASSTAAAIELELGAEVPEWGHALALYGACCYLRGHPRQNPLLAEAALCFEQAEACLTKTGEPVDWLEYYFLRSEIYRIARRPFGAVSYLYRAMRLERRMLQGR